MILKQSCANNYCKYYEKMFCYPKYRVSQAIVIVLKIIYFIRALLTYTKSELKSVHFALIVCSLISYNIVQNIEFKKKEFVMDVPNPFEESA